MSDVQLLQRPRSPRLRLGEVVTAWHELIERFFSPYRPERHYMRGPGPKWRAKQRSPADRI